MRNDAMPLGEIDKTFNDLYLEVKLAVIYPAIRNELAAKDQVEGIMHGKFTGMSTYEKRMEAKVYLLGFYHENAGASGNGSSEPKGFGLRSA
jgi:hypothetical protein